MTRIFFILFISAGRDWSIAALTVCLVLGWILFGLLTVRPARKLILFLGLSMVCIATIVWSYLRAVETATARFNRSIDAQVREIPIGSPCPGIKPKLRGVYRYGIDGKPFLFGHDNRTVNGKTYHVEYEPQGLAAVGVEAEMLSGVPGITVRCDEKNRVLEIWR